MTIRGVGKPLPSQLYLMQLAGLVVFGRGKAVTNAPTARDERSDEQHTGIVGDWTESNNPEQSLVHTFRFLDTGEFHESGPAIITIGDSAPLPLKKDLDGDGVEELLSFNATGSWSMQDNELQLETSSSNIGNSKQASIRRFRIEELAENKLVLVLLKASDATERWSFFRRTKPDAQ